MCRRQLKPTIILVVCTIFSWSGCGEDSPDNEETLSEDGGSPTPTGRTNGPGDEVVVDYSSVAINSISPEAAKVGQFVTIMGENLGLLGSTQDIKVVFTPNAEAEIVEKNDSSIDVKVPLDAQSGSVVLKTRDTQFSESLDFLVLPDDGSNENNITPPQNFSVVNNDDGTITFTWDAVAGGFGYVVQASLDPDSTFPADDFPNTKTPCDTNDSATTTCTWTPAPVDANQLHYCVIRSRGADGESAISDVITVTTLAEMGSVQLSAKDVDENGHTLIWDGQSGATTGYKVFRSADSAGPFTLMGTTTADTTEMTFAGLAADSKYYYQVAVVNAGGTSLLSPSTSVFFGTTPLAPVINAGTLNASLTGGKIQWAASTFVNNSGNYVTYIGRDSAGPFYPINEVGDDALESLSITGLQPGISYYFVVRAKAVVDFHSSVEGLSAPSNVISLVRDVADNTDPAPATPTSLAVVSDDVNQVEISWADGGDSDYGNFPASKTFLVEMTEQSTPVESDWVTVSENSGLYSEHNHHNLQAGKTYKFRICGWSHGSSNRNCTSALSVVPVSP